MREILFKAKRIDNGEWVEGYLLKYIKPRNGDIEYRIFVSDGDGVTWYTVIENTICQYTGLTDKNGNKIWENDIVDVQHYASKAHKVKWGYGGFYVGMNGLLCHYNTLCEVIGNVFDNPEFVEVNKEVYYEDYRLKVIKKESGKYDIHDSKYGGKITHKDVSKEQADERIQEILSIRNRRQNRNRKE